MQKRPSCKTCKKQSWCKTVSSKEKFNWIFIPLFLSTPRYKIPSDWLHPLFSYPPPKEYKEKYLELDKESRKKGVIPADKWTKSLLDIYCPFYKRTQWKLYFDLSVFQSLFYPSLRQKGVLSTIKNIFLV